MMNTTGLQSNYQIVFYSDSHSPVAYVGERKVFLSEFKHDVLTLLEHLKSRKITKTLISATDRYAFSVSLLASWMAEATVILPPDQLERTLHQIRVKQAPGFECDKGWCERLLSRQSTAKQGEHGSWEIMLPGSLAAVVLYTSGSSGEPARIHKSLANLLEEVKCLHASFDWPDAAIVGTVPAQHLYGLTFSMLLPWVSGRPWVDAVPLYPQDVATVIKQSQAATLISVPAHYNALIQDDLTQADLFCVSAAAPLSKQTASQWYAKYQQHIMEIYGSTETGVIAHRQQIIHPDWQLFEPVRTAVESGLLNVKSPFVSAPSADGFQTADQVVFKSSNQFELLGRSDSIVKIAGKRVSLKQVESALISCAGIQDAAAFVVDVEGLVRDKAIWAVLETRRGKTLSLAVLRKELQQKLDGVSIPKRFVLVDKLPRNASGKLTRRSLKEMFSDEGYDV